MIRRLKITTIEKRKSICCAMVKEIFHNGKPVLVIDYSNCTGDQMIELFEQARAMVLASATSVVILLKFNSKTFVSPSFMRHTEKYLPEVAHLIDRQAIIGLSTVQEWILKGVNLWYNRKIHKFDTEAEALEFLTLDDDLIKEMN